MGLTYTSLDFIIKTTLGLESRKFDSATANIGVGDNATGYSKTQTDLLATTNKVYKPMVAGYPQNNNQDTLTFRATFGSNDANFPWQEWGVFRISGTDKLMLNRTKDYCGTKLQGQTWTITAQLVFYTN